MDDAERQLLAKEVDRRLRFERSGAVPGLITICALLATGGGCLAGALTRSVATGVLGTIVAALVGLSVGLLIFLAEARRGAAWKRAAERDLEAGLVEEASFEATRAAAPFLDPLDCLFLEVGGGALLFLKGDYMEGPIRSGTFPSRRFSIVRAPCCHVPLKLIPAGKPLDVEPADIRDSDAVDFGPEDGELIPGSIETLHADLEAWFRAAR